MYFLSLEQQPKRLSQLASCEYKLHEYHFWRQFIYCITRSYVYTSISNAAAGNTSYLQIVLPTDAFEILV